LQPLKVLVAASSGISSSHLTSSSGNDFTAANDTAFARGRRHHQPGRKMKLSRSSTLSPNLFYSRGASIAQDFQPLPAQAQGQLLLAPADVSESLVDVLSQGPEPSLENKVL
jgi:hypothetical protein